MIQRRQNDFISRSKISRSQEAEEVIRNYILDKRLAPGDAIPPTTEFARELGMSRSSVREAIKSLEAVGVIDSRPGTGLFVGNLSFESLVSSVSYSIRLDFKRITELLELRFYLEYGMIDALVHSVNDDQLKALQLALDSMEAAARRGEYSPRSDSEFHDAMFVHINNPFVMQILDLFWDVIGNLSADAKSAMNLERPDPLATHARHVRIFDALSSRDTQALRLAVMDHYMSFNSPFGVPSLAAAYRELALQVIGSARVGKQEGSDENRPGG